MNMLQTQEQQGSGTVATIGPLKAFAVCSKVRTSYANFFNDYNDFVTALEMESETFLIVD